MPSNRPLNSPPIGMDFFRITLSVSSEASARAAGVGPFVGLFFITSSSVTITGFSGNTLPIDNAAKNATIWIQGSYLSVIATATSVYGLL